MTTSDKVRARLVEMLRRDLVGPLPPDVAPSDADLQNERLREPPSSWYLTGFIAPLDEGFDEADNLDAQEEAETDAGDLADGATESGPLADDDAAPETPSTSRRYLPASIGLTVLVPDTVDAVAVRITWGDYVTEPPLPTGVLLSDDADAPKVEWLRRPRERSIRVPVPRAGKGDPILVPDSAPEQRPGGALEIQAHARPFTLKPPGEPSQPVRALSLFLVNRRKPVRRRYADVAFAFQPRLEVRCDEGLTANRDRTGYDSDDADLRIADLHYRDEAEYAVGRNTSGGWEAPDVDGRVRRAWTDPLPMAEVERVAPNEEIPDVVFGMEALAEAGFGERCCHRRCTRRLAADITRPGSLDRSALVSELAGSAPADSGAP